MAIGIGASIVSITDGTTAHASDVLTSLNNLNAAGVSNDGGTISTSGSGVITGSNGILRNVSILATPFQLTVNPTVTSGSTTTLTCTGGSTGVPTGAIAVFIGGGIFAATTGGYAQIYPAGGTAGQYAAWAGMPSNAFTAGWVIAPLSAGGQITVKANASNIVLQTWYIFGYIL